jgi:CHAT domain-containing protein
VLSYFCLGHQVVAVVGRGDDLRVVPVADVAQVLDLLARFAAQRDRLRLGAAFAERHGARLVQSCRNVLGDLHDALVAPVLADLQERPASPPLVVSPHGPLHAVPFHALWAGDRYLIDERAVAVTPSLALEAPRRTEAATTPPLIVGVADDLAPLAAVEARAVHERIGGDLLHGEAATADAFVEAAAGRSLIHLATHAWHRSDNPMFSAIRFADRWLTAAEVLERLDLTGAVVVLSACETGRSSTTGGDELLGLVRGFLGAGTRRLVASLWPADDAATAELMDHFHLSLATDGVASALRTAQLRTRETFPHPSHWAPFVVLGAS